MYRFLLSAFLIGLGVPLTSLPAMAADAPVWRVDAAYARSTFSRRDQADWHEETISLVRKLDQGRAFGVFAATERRYGQNDPTLGGLWVQPLGTGATGTFRLSATPDADFLPRWTAEAAFDVPLLDWGGDMGGTAVLTFIGRHKDYAAGDVDNLNPGLVQYLAGGRLWLSATWINGFEDSIDKRLGGYLVRADVQATDRFRLFAGRSFAPEADSGSVVDVRNGFVGATYDLNDVTALRFDYAREDRKNSYLRNVFSINLTRRF